MPTVLRSCDEVYLNPFLDKLTLEVHNYDGYSEVLVELIDLSTGETLIKETYDQSVVELKNTSLPAGAYVLKVSYNKVESLMKRMIKVD